MQGQLPKHAVLFRERYAHVENLLRRSGYLKKRSKRAEVDWAEFAKQLGEPFFEHANESLKARTLIGEPPRVLDRNLVWQPTTQQPILNVVELFERGVCQVRNNIVHGEKYIDSAEPRDDALVLEAHWVLEQAIQRHHDAKKIFASL